MTELETATAEPSSITELRRKLEKQIKNGADWFFWIAGLSVLNSLVLIFGGGWNFLIGLGITQVVDGFMSALAAEFSSPATTIIRLFGLLISIGLAGVPAFFGFFARKGRKWSFVIGIILYALDGLIFLLVGAWASFRFHLFALLWISVGLWAKNQLDKVERGETDALVYPKPLITKGPRPRSYWVKLALVAGVLLLPLLVFLVLLFTAMY